MATKPRQNEEGKSARGGARRTRRLTATRARERASVREWRERERARDHAGWREGRFL